MKDADKHRAEVLWKNAKDSKLARKEIAKMTDRHKDRDASLKDQLDAS